MKQTFITKFKNALQQAKLRLKKEKRAKELKDRELDTLT